MFADIAINYRVKTKEEVMFLSDSERKEMDAADWRLYHYKIKKMDVVAQRGLL